MTNPIATVREAQYELRSLSRIITARGARRPLVEIADALDAVVAEIERLRGNFDREADAHKQTLGERDQAEETIDRMFSAVTGREPEWSSAWGHDDAFEEVENAIGAMQAEAARLRMIETPAVQDVVNERARQIEVEGWTPEHDDRHAAGELATAAAVYASYAADRMHLRSQEYGGDGPPPLYWPWDRHWRKPTTPRRELVKAAALILAEIERLDRAGIGKGESNEG